VSGAAALATLDALEDVVRPIAAEHRNLWVAVLALLLQETRPGRRRPGR